MSDPFGDFRLARSIAELKDWHEAKYGTLIDIDRIGYDQAEGAYYFAHVPTGASIVASIGLGGQDRPRLLDGVALAA